MKDACDLLFNLIRFSLINAPMKLDTLFMNHPVHRRILMNRWHHIQDIVTCGDVHRTLLHVPQLQALGCTNNSSRAAEY